MGRPVLSLQTVYFDQTDQEDARELGTHLYQCLTRPIEDPLSYGPRIPVRVGVREDRVAVEAADVVVLIPVLGNVTYLSKKDSVVKRIGEWHETLKSGKVLPLFTSANWRAESRFPGYPLLTKLDAPEDPLATLDAIAIAVSRLLDPSAQTVRLIISHAGSGPQPAEETAKMIHAYIRGRDVVQTFFEFIDRPPEEAIDAAGDAPGRGVVIAVRTDDFGSRVWCQRELLKAKQLGIPTLTVEVLKAGERRSSPYAGNSPCVVWTGDPGPVVSRTLTEWLRALHFRRDADRIIRAANLPSDTKVVTRPPELLDLAQGPIRSDFAQLVLHPDPELSPVERRVLRAARPRLRLVTPTTAFRRLLNRDDRSGAVASPLEGMQVALSVSTSSDLDGPDGYTRHHLIDATLHIARTLVSSGAMLSYGGDFRIENGFTLLLAGLIETYNQTAPNETKNLYKYYSATDRVEDSPVVRAIAMHPSLPSMSGLALMPAPSRTDPHPKALYVSDMRRMMAKKADARVVLGGQTTPRLGDSQGYGGRYPGIVEEAWRTLEAKKPLYILGGFGGAASLVADLLEGKPTPEALRDKTWRSHEEFVRRALEIDQDVFREKLGLPATMDDLAKRIRRLGLLHLESDKAAIAWNGLTVEENRRLFRSRDPVRLASLVSKGLMLFSDLECQDQLEIELVKDSLTGAADLDAIAIATIDHVPLGGAGAILDQSIGGRASLARAGNQELVSLEESDLDAGWLMMVSLGGLAELGLPDRVEEAATQVASLATRHGFRRVGLVTFGGNMVTDTEPIARAMVKGLRKLPAGATVAWFETRADQFERLQTCLEGEAGVRVTTQVPQVPVAGAYGNEPIVVHVRLENGQLAATSLLPSGSAVAPVQSFPLSEKRLAKLAAGFGGGRQTPDASVLAERGEKLANELFGANAAQILDRCRQSKVVVIHDIASSKIPFEILGCRDPKVWPALESGISRRLAVDGVPFESQFAKPPRVGKLRVLLISNPTRNLDGAAEEAAALKKILAQQEDLIDLKVLDGGQATKKAITAELERSDILHYCGHAFFEGPGANQSGLVVASGREFTSTDLRKIKKPPRMAFVNSCETARIRGSREAVAASFTELFLRNGVEAYLGTYWQLGDEAAVRFANEVYLQLAIGETLETAVLKARNALKQGGHDDWANYMLFGGGNFRLVVT